ncbi:hypothetical protein I4U23_011054 [Adineta vaga]|nr:hypothetical protein I4U23_011054 [Adineta vaga]
MARNLRHRLWESFLRLNLFKKTSSDDQTLSKEHIATRIYICLLSVCVVAITVFAAFMIRTVEKTEYAPSQSRFLQLTHNYPNTLHCPCSRSDITYNTFVSAKVNFHHVCSSQFTQQIWIDMIFTNENISVESTDDFRVTLSFFWQIIAGLCVTSKRSWDDAVASFGVSSILTPTAIVEDIVRTQVQTTLNEQIVLSQAAVARDLLAIRRMTSGNQIVSGLQTNFYLRYPPEGFGSTYATKMTTRVFNDCSCLRIEGCPHPATFKDSHGHLVTVQGMIMDCLMVDAALASTLECYYNQTCLSLLHQPLPLDIKPLSNSSLIHFSTQSTVQMLLDELMIDQTISNIRFDLYYTQCNPAYCSYSYTHRFDILFMFTTIIGIFGGLSLVIKLLAPLIATVILRRKNPVLLVENVTYVRAPQQYRRKL